MIVGFFKNCKVSISRQNDSRMYLLEVAGSKLLTNISRIAFALLPLQGVHEFPQPHTISPHLLLGLLAHSFGVPIAGLCSVAAESVNDWHQVLSSNDQRQEGQIAAAWLLNWL